MTSEEKEWLNTFIGAGLEYVEELSHYQLFVSESRRDLKDLIEMFKRKAHEEHIINSIKHNIKRLEVYEDICCRTFYELEKMLKSRLERSTKNAE